MMGEDAMILQNTKISTRLSAGFATTIILVIILNAYMINNMVVLSGLTTQLYEHPFSVSKAILRIDGNIIRMHRTMKDVVLSNDKNDIEQAVKIVDELESMVLDDFALVDKKFLGDKSKVDIARHKFLNWKQIRDEVIQLIYLGKKEAAAEITKAKGATYVKDLHITIGEFINFAELKAEAFLTEANTARDNTLTLTVISLLFVILVTVLFAVYFTRSITKPLSLALKTSNQLAEGNLDVEIKITGKDELANLLNSIRNLTIKLREATKENEEKVWIKTGQNELFDLIRNEKDIENCANLISSFLAKYLNGQIVTFYVAENKDELHLRGNYGVEISSTKKIITHQKGLIGQSIAEQQLLLIDNLPDDYLSIGSSIGAASPKHIAILPLFLNNKVQGVVEIGSFEKFTEIKLEFLNRISIPVGSFINILKSNIHTELLLKETQNQSAKLQEQQNNLEKVNIDLEQQTLLLLQSEDKLLHYSYELKQEVEKRTRQLEDAKTELEINLTREKELVHLKSQFISMISHEFRTPLTVISSSLEIVKLCVAKGDIDKIEKYIDNSFKSISVLTEFIEEALRLNENNFGHIEKDLNDIEIGRLFKNIVFKINENRGISHKIILNKAGNFSSIHSDELILSDILHRLIHNAIKYSKENTEISLGFSENESQYLVEVSDQGIGISADEKEKIFDSFFRGKEHIGITEGLGINLFIVKQNVNALGGEITVESTLGKGTRFRIVLPKES